MGDPDDSDIIAWLYPPPSTGKGFQEALEIIEGCKGTPMHVPCKRPAAAPSARKPKHRTREATPPDDMVSENNNSNDPGNLYDGIAIRFSVETKSRVGVIIGTNPLADIIAKDAGQVSGFHAAIKFDDKNRLIVKDLATTNGTSVTYGNDTTASKRREFTWLLTGPSTPPRTSSRDRPPIVLELASCLKFQVVVPPHDLASPEYRKKVTLFGQSTTDTDGLIERLVLDRSEKPTPAGQSPDGKSGLPSSKVVEYSRRLGEGNFGIVTYRWNVTTGEERAVKMPKKKNNGASTEGLKMWEKELAILKQISHAHIVKYLKSETKASETEPSPGIFLEYVAGGALTSHKPLTTRENTQVLCQLLSALEYLHTHLETPIAHRDIKPDNILVAYRKPSGIFVKFGDFGLAKAANYMSTKCGSHYYMAPELTNNSLKKHKKYGVGVDIYSLGITIMSLGCHMPEFTLDCEKGNRWATKVVHHLETLDRDNKLMKFLLEHMVVIDPTIRKNASYCRAAAELLLEATYPQSSALPPPDSQIQGQACTKDTTKPAGEVAKKQASPGPLIPSLSPPTAIHLPELSDAPRTSPRRPKSATEVLRSGLAAARRGNLSAPAAVPQGRPGPGYAKDELPPVPKQKSEVGHITPDVARPVSGGGENPQEEDAQLGDENEDAHLADENEDAHLADENEDAHLADENLAVQDPHDRKRLRSGKAASSDQDPDRQGSEGRMGGSVSAPPAKRRK